MACHDSPNNIRTSAGMRTRLAVVHEVCLAVSLSRCLSVSLSLCRCRCLANAAACAPAKPPITPQGLH
eukprot:1117498-Rhodomonas_salina.1